MDYNLSIFVTMKKALKLLISLVLILSSGSLLAQTTFTFTLNRSFRTSAGVFKTDGTLIRALWKDVTYPQGTFTSTWDNKDDIGVVAPAGNYQIKVLYHNMQYVWDGSIGQTSASPVGQHTYKGYHSFQSFAACDTAVFYTMGYNEMVYDLHWFPKANITNPTGFFQSDNFTAIGLVATDGIMVYSADNQGGFQSAGTTSFIWANKLTAPNNITNPTKDIYNFPNSRIVQLNGTRGVTYYAIDYDATSVIPATSNGLPFIQNGASGLAVQVTGNLLAVSHYAANQIRLFDKTSGALLSTITATAPKHVSFSSEGDLWAIVNGNVIRYTNPGTSPAIATTISSLQHPLSVCVDPVNPNIVMVADGGASQQVKAFDKLGNTLWTLGEYNAYPLGGTQVRNDKFWFYDGSQGEEACIAILKDHSFWVSDNYNNRLFHYSGGIPTYIEQIISQPARYGLGIDANNPSRIFTEYQEFSIDYTKPLAQGWTYVKNWGANLDKNVVSGFTSGIRQMVTDAASGKTFGISKKNSTSSLIVLPNDRSSNIKFTGEILGNIPNYMTTLNSDLSLTLAPNYGANGTTVTWLKYPVPTVDTSGVLTYGASTVIASAVEIGTDPLPNAPNFADDHAYISSSNILISYNTANSNKMWHVGGMNIGGTQWLWKSGRVGSINRKGAYDLDHYSQYQGDVVNVQGRNIVCGFHGEFWNNAQAGQFMHYYDDGLFVGEFGNSSYGYYFAVGNIPGFAGNGLEPVMCTVNGEVYLWISDESCNGPQRWHLVGANNIHEQAATITLNGSGTLSFLN